MPGTGTEAVAEVRTRLDDALWLLRQGEGPTAVAAVVGVSRNAVQQWLRWYRCGGLAAECGPIERGGPGKPSYLTPDQAEQLVAAAAAGVFATARGCAGLDRGAVRGGLHRGQACTRCCRDWGSG